MLPYHHLLPPPEFFESIMLICFGMAWPLSIYKSYRSKTNQGKSVYFLFVILFGYVNGIIFQMTTPGLSSKMLILFGINALLVVIDIVLYYRNKYLERGRT